MILVGEQMITRQEIIKNISLAIKNSRKTQAEIAKDIGVSKRTMARYAAGEQCMSLSRFMDLCDFLHLDCNEILYLKKRP